MNIIFLDIDGVLNTESTWRVPYSLTEDCIIALAKLIKKTNAKIVLTSSWRTGFFQGQEEKAKQTPQIINLEQRLAEHGVTIYDKTPKYHESGYRDKEINFWLSRHPEVKGYIILDDDRSEFEKLPKGFYQVNSKTGLTAADVKKISM